MRRLEVLIPRAALRSWCNCSARGISDGRLADPDPVLAASICHETAVFTTAQLAPAGLSTVTDLVALAANFAGAHSDFPAILSACKSGPARCPCYS